MSDHPFTETIDLADLSQWSPWPARLLGLTPWQTVERTTEKVEQEYGKEKYGACREYLKQHPSATPEDLKWCEMGDASNEICVSTAEQLFKTTVGEAWKHYCNGIDAFIKPLMDETDIVCDLGCGYGYHLWFLKQRYPEKVFWGGEFTQSAVDIAGQLFGSNGPSIEKLDLTDPNFTIPFTIEDRVLVLSAYAFHQLPACAQAIKHLNTIKGPQWNICHVEPVIDWCSSSLLGTLRKSYTLHNDYNRDMYAALIHEKVHIIREQREWFGINPLHPASLIHWQ